MTGYVTLYGGGVMELPPLLQWNVTRTDAEPCDAFSVQFAYEPELVQRLQLAVRFFAEHEGKRVITGVVDDVTVSLGKNGRLAEVTGRSLAALLLDTQVRAAEYQSAQLADILAGYVYPCGVRQVDAQNMGQINDFVIETGYSCYQVLAGFCRHSADIRPRFSADGTLILRKDAAAGARISIRGGCVQARYTFDRYSAAAKQVMVNTRNGSEMTVNNGAFQAMGGSSVHVTGMTGQKIRAAWRTAKQRLDDSWRTARILRLTLAGGFLAEPAQTAAVMLPELGVEGTFTVRAVESVCDETGALCTLELIPKE